MGKNKAEQRAARIMRDSIVLPVRVEQVAWDQDKLLKQLSINGPILIPLVRRVK